MNAALRDHPAFRAEALRLGGERVTRARTLDVFDSYTGIRVGTVPLASIDDVRAAFDYALAYRPTLSRYERSQILERAAALLRERTEKASDLISLESGLSKQDSRYEIGRVADVCRFASIEALRDDAQSYSCDLTPHGRRRREFSQREPLAGVIVAITPFNHSMNQVAHKVAPAIATNNRVVLKPSEKVPLSALYLADLLYEAGLPAPMLQVLTGDPREIGDELITRESGELVRFTGGVAIGKSIATTAGYRRVVLELGGSDPLIVLDDVDPSMTLVREESFGPVWPVIAFDTIDDAIRISNGTPFGLSSGVCTNRQDAITRFINELRVGTVNVWEVPGYRIELTSFGGIKDSGLGYKEGVQEAMKSFTNLKTFSLPWE
ncbi:phosphonoacetaldehyde dehydrogenase [Burkholderia sp. H160]|nr:phosphonoacetaldehyde dehydrogenase [Burkholderia sp. H160]